MEIGDWGLGIWYYVGGLRYVNYRLGLSTVAFACGWALGMGDVNWGWDFGEGLERGH